MTGIVAHQSVDEVFAEGTRGVTSRKHEPNDVMWLADKCYLYVQASTVLAANDAIIISETGSAKRVSTSNSNNEFGQRVGVAPAAFAADEYGWIQVYGVATVNAGSSAAAAAKLNSTATVGRLDDDATSGAREIDGLVFTSAASGNEAEAMLVHPTVGATI